MGDTPSPTPDAVSEIVELLHGLPRPSGDADFEATKAYAEGLISLFASVGCVFVLLTLFYLIFLFCRCCCKCCQLSVDDVAKHNTRCGSGVQRIAFFFWLLLTMAMMCCTYFGRNQFQEGVVNLADNAQALGSIFESLNSQGFELSDYANSFSSNVDAMSCLTDDYTSSFADYASSFSDSVDTMNDLWDGLDDDFYSIETFFEDSAPGYVDMGVAAITAVVCFVCVIGILGDLTKSWVIFNCMSFFGVLVMLLLALFGGLELTLSVAFADVCYAGVDSSFLDLASWRLPDEPYSLINYYVTCTGSNPLFVPLNASMAMMEGLNDTLIELKNEPMEVCTPESAITGMQSACGGSVSTVDAIQHTIGCETLNPIYRSLTYETLCSDVVEGLYYLWLVQFIGAFMLYVSLYCASYTKEKVILDAAVEKKKEEFSTGPTIQLSEVPGDNQY